MKLGEIQVLTMVKRVDFGVYLGSDTERVLLPGKQVPDGLEPGDPVEVFLYKDSRDRMIATTNRPKLTLGELAVLQVVDTGRIGAFLDWGLEKDLLLPFHEQTAKVEKGDSCLVTLYIDKSERLCATMKVYPLLQTNAPYRKDDRVTGIIYDRSDEFGVFVAVDERYSALIPRKEVHRKLQVGSRVEARVTEVRADGKLNLSLREKIPQQMEKDAEKILRVMEKYEGRLPFTDKAKPEIIQREFGMSKAAFKRAVGRLLKAGKIDIQENAIVRKK
ncbi:MAG: S1 RNA-binding domain-containing protein [Hespellia sp.]|nr:S1 RNA-binding domain-containing protein [Hespellia sp.]